VLGTRGLDSPAGGEGSYRFLCTGEPAPFRAQGTRFLQLPLGEVERVRLGDPVGGAVAA
jgi:glutamate racemase